MARLWAKIRVDLRHHPKVIGRPDSDFRLWTSLLLHAKEHCPDGVVRGMGPADMRGAWGIKAPAENVRRALAYFVKEGMLVERQDGLLIRDFVDEQRVAKDNPDAALAHKRRQREKEKADRDIAGVTGSVTGPPSRDIPGVTAIEGELELEVEKDLQRKGEEISSMGVAANRGSPSLFPWDPVLLVDLRKALGKDELDTDFARFLASSMKYPKPQREAAAREFLARGCAGDGKGTSYLLAMIRDGAGQRKPSADRSARQVHTDTGGARVPDADATRKYLDEQEAHADQVRKEREARGGKAPRILGQLGNGKHS